MHVTFFNAMTRVPSRRRALVATALAALMVFVAGCVSRGVAPSRAPKPWSRAQWNRDIGRASKGLAKSPWPASRCDAMRTSQSPAPGPRKPKVKWAYRSSDRIFGVVVAPDGSIYVPDGESLLALSAAGKMRWRRPVVVTGSASVGTGPFVRDDGAIVVYSREKRLCCFDRAGQLVSTTPIPLNLEQGIAYAAGPKGTIYLGGDRPMRRSLIAIGRDGIVKWTVRTSGFMVPPAIDASGYIWFSGRIFRPTGKPLARQYDHPNDQDLVLGPGGLIYNFLWHDVGDMYSSAGMIVAQNRSGRVIWRYKTDSAPDRLALSWRGILYATDDGHLTALNARTGRLLRRTSVGMGGNIYGPSIDSEGNVYVCAGERMESMHTTLSVRRPDGTVAWRMKLEGSPSDRPAVGTGRTVLVCTELFYKSGDPKGSILYCIGEQ